MASSFRELVKRLSAFEKLTPRGAKSFTMWSARSTALRRRAAPSARRFLCSTRDSFHVTGELTKIPPCTIPSVGVEASVTHSFTITDTVQFAQLNGDSNPIHTDALFAKEHAGVDAPIVQGMLSASLFATIFGRTIPGAVYISQNLRWRTPLLVGEPVRARIRVVKVRKRFVDCETLCEKVEDGTIILEGQATVLLPPPPAAAAL